MRFLNQINSEEEESFSDLDKWVVTLKRDDKTTSFDQINKLSTTKNFAFSVYEPILIRMKKNLNLNV